MSGSLFFFLCLNIFLLFLQLIYVSMKNKLPNFFYILLLLLISFIYDYHHIAFKRPQSVHAWRQSDGASLALNYSREGMQFFQPRVHNLTADEGTSGKSATSEIPFLYYTVALFYKVFGYHEFIYRILNTLIFLTGLFYLFRAVRIQTKDWYWSVVIPLFLFSSPLIAYYGNNFLSNTTALSMVFIAWFFAFRYIHYQKRSDLLWMFFFFFIAGALKVTALISFFALAAVFLLEHLFNLRVREDRKLFPEPLPTIAGGIITLLPIVSWVIYAGWYNKIHDTTYFSTTLFPIWSLDKGSIQNILLTIKEIWLTEYFHPSAMVFTGILFFFVFIFQRKEIRLLLWILIFLMVEVILYITLQFWTFRDHDYYTINLYILPVFIFLTFATVLKYINLHIYLRYGIKAGFFILLIINLNHSKNKLEQRYTGDKNYSFLVNNDFYSITPHLRETGIDPIDTVISFSDRSHVSLYLMDQKGWTRYTDMKYNRSEPFKYNQDSAGIQRSIDRGARYLIINGFDDLYNNEFLAAFTKHLKSTYRNIMIFEPANPDQNFTPSEREIIFDAFCSAEETDSTAKYLIDTSGNFIFENTITRSKETALTGKWSCKLKKGSEFGMTCRINNLKHGESVKINVWKKGGDKPGVISVQTDDFQLFHAYGEKLTGNIRGSWVEMEMDFFIPFKLDNKDLKIYLYNPRDEPVFFDDFRIRRYKSVLENS